MKPNINFLFEIGSLRKVPRAWQQVMTAQVQNISEHIFRTALIAWTIAEAEDADIGKVLKICLIHDIAESRATDIAFMHRDYVTRHEDTAQIDILKGTLIEKEATELLKEYEERETLEAKIVKDADNLEVDLELKELARVGDTAAIGMQKHHRHIVREQKLYTKTAMEIWDLIQTTDPDEWHQELTDKWVNNKNAAR